MKIERKWIFPSILITLLIVSTIWGVNQYEEKKDLRTQLQNQQQRGFYELIGDVENIQVNIAKSLVADDPLTKSDLYNRIWKDSMTAQARLNQLPISHLAINDVSRFLSQVGDYSYSLAKGVVDGVPTGADNRENLSQIHANMGNLAEDLHSILERINEGRIRLGDLRREGRKEFIRDSITDLDNEFETVKSNIQDYPKMIYDGPFSEHLVNREPVEIEGEEITFEEGKKIVRKVVGEDRIKDLRSGNDGDGLIKTYGYDIIPENARTDNERIYIHITKKGGNPAWMLHSREINEKKLTEEKALNRAEEFLESIGFENFKASYSFINDESATINFAYTEDEVVIYPDLIKVKVALDNGEVIGMESQGYLMAHHDRDLPEPELTVEEARMHLSDYFNEESSRLAVIPIPGGNEVLCYEFSGTYQDDSFLIYIDAVEGSEVEVLKMIEDQFGTLLM